MLTVLVGSNTKERTKRLDALLAPLEKDGADIRRYNDVTFSLEALKANAQSASLFGEKIVSVVSGVGDRAEQREELETLLPLLSESDQLFFVSEQSLLVAFLKKAKSANATLEEFGEKVALKKKETFNIFSLTDAFADKKRSTAWTLYNTALSSGLEAREIHGKFFWITKTLLLAESAETAQEAGLHPFVFQKSKASLKNFAPGELTSIAHDLAVLFHDATFTGKNMEIELEAWLLRALEKKQPA